MSSHQYHVPVLAEQVVQQLCGNRNAVIVDGTLGGGGHFDLLGRELGSEATLVGIDRDPDAIAYNSKREHETPARVVIEQGVFSEVGRILKKNSIHGMDGMLLDLGVSSFQIDSDERGFSYMRECDLDMRMNRDDRTTASGLLSEIGEEELATILTQYGEVGNAGRMARTLISNPHPLRTSRDLRECLQREYGPNIKYKVLAKVFMALRIAVNNELGELQQALEQVVATLNAGGRFAVITYHSLEDRMVKEFFRSSEPHCICNRNTLMCTCGTPGILKRITRKPIIATTEEIANNPRARSARLRVAEKL